MGTADRRGLRDCIVSSLEGSKLKINIFFFCLHGFVFWVLFFLVFFLRAFFTEQNLPLRKEKKKKKMLPWRIFYAEHTMGSFQPASLGATGWALRRGHRHSCPLPPQRVSPPSPTLSTGGFPQSHPRNDWNYETGRKSREGFVPQATHREPLHIGPVGGPTP